MLRATFASCLLVSALIAVAAMPAGADPGDKTRCSGKIAQEQRSTLLTFRVRCNFEVTRLSVRSSLPVVRTGEPRLDGPDPEDRLSCSRSSRSLAVCKGQVGENVRVREALRVRGRGCEAAKLRFRMTGGEDCDPHGVSCPALERSFALTVKRTAAC